MQVASESTRILEQKTINEGGLVAAFYEQSTSFYVGRLRTQNHSSLGMLRYEYLQPHPEGGTYHAC